MHQLMHALGVCAAPTCIQAAAGGLVFDLLWKGLGTARMLIYPRRAELFL